MGARWQGPAAGVTFDRRTPPSKGSPMPYAHCPPSPPPSYDDLAAENTRLSERVQELEHLLHLERSRNAGLERGLSALSERVVELRKPHALGA